MLIEWWSFLPKNQHFEFYFQEIRSSGVHKMRRCPYRASRLMSLDADIMRTFLQKVYAGYLWLDEKDLVYPLEIAIIVIVLFVLAR